MRFWLLGGIALASLVLSAPAGANTLNFTGISGAATSCSLAGNAGDRSCTHTGSFTNGANDATASANVRGQASADQALGTDPTAIADMLISYDIPYTVTRTINITGPAPFNANVPIQTITFNVNLSGEVSKDNSQVGGGLGQALENGATFQSLGGLFTTGTYDAASQTGGGGLARTVVNDALPDPSFGTSVNFSGAAVGEITLLAQIPTDYRLWSDFVPPVVTFVGQTVTQSFSDTLRVTFRLRAESRSSGSVSTTGGEALACFGQTSPLGGFVLDNAASCGSGFDITGTVTQTSTSVVPVPEPTTLGLLGAALAGLAYFGARRRH